MQPNDLEASGQRFRQVRDEEYIGGTGEYEAAGHSPAVHVHLDGFEQRRDMLYLVQDDALRQIRNEIDGTGSRTLSCNGVVETEVGVVAVPARPSPARALAAPGDVARRMGVLGKSCLAALTRTVDQHDRRILQRLRQPVLDVARVEDGPRHRLIASFGFGPSKGVVAEVSTMPPGATPVCPARRSAPGSMDRSH